MDASGVFHYRIDAYSGILEGLHDDVMVRLTAVGPDGTEMPGGFERLSDAELTAIAQAQATKRPDETSEEYERRVMALVTWSQRHLIELLAKKRQAIVLPRRKVELVLAG